MKLSPPLLALIACGGALLIVLQLVHVFSPSSSPQSGDFGAGDSSLFTHCSCSFSPRCSSDSSFASSQLQSASPVSHSHSDVQLVFVRGLAASLRSFPSQPIQSSDDSAAALSLSTASSLPSLSSSTARKRVLLVSQRVDGLTASDGIGTVTTAMARLLAEQHEVSILFVPTEGFLAAWTPAASSTPTPVPSVLQSLPSSSSSYSDLLSSTQSLYRNSYNVSLITIPTAHALNSSWGGVYEKIRSYEVMRWLTVVSGDYDIVHFHDWGGLAFYTYTAAQQGHPAFQRLTFVTQVHKPSLWAQLGSENVLDSVTALEIDFMERHTVTYSQWVVAPTAYILKWMVQHDYRFPSQQPQSDDLSGDSPVQPVVVMPFPTHSVLAGVPAATSAANCQSVADIRELVFFGRLEHRKGLDIFLDATDSVLAARRERDLPLPRLTLLGEVAADLADPLLTRLLALAKQPSNWTLLTNLSSTQAIEYMLDRSAGRLAVMPSRLDNSPAAVKEMLLHCIPFLASEVGGVAELLTADDRQYNLVEPNAVALAARLEVVLTHGISLAKAAYSSTQISRDWLDWHSKLPTPAPRRMVIHQEDDPLVTIVLATYNRTSYLLESLTSLRDQTYPNVEVILVDDGTTHPASLAVLQQAKDFIYGQPGWQFLVAPHGGESKARNLGARMGHGEYILFMDDDNVARLEEIAELVRAMRYTNADILTCLAENFKGDGFPQPSLSDPSIPPWLPLGGAPGVNAFRNTIGDANFLGRRQLVLDLGGFPMTQIAEDWEFLTHALLSGANIQVVPQVLWWKRVTKLSMRHSTQMRHSKMRVSDAFLGPHVRHDYGVALLMARQAMAAQEKLAKEAAVREKEAAATKAVMLDQGYVANIASSQQHFAPRQRYKQWFYQYQREEDRASGTFHLMDKTRQRPNSTVWEWYVAKLPDRCWIRALQQQPCLDHKSQLVQVVRSWRADFDGEVLVSGTLDKHKHNACPDSDGVRLSVFANTTTYFEAIVHVGEVVDIPRLTVPVVYGDMIHIAAHPVENGRCDNVNVDVRISQRTLNGMA